MRSQSEVPPMNFWYLVGFRELDLFTFLSFAKIVVCQLPRVLFSWVYDTDFATLCPPLSQGFPQTFSVMTGFVINVLISRIFCECLALDVIKKYF